MQIGMVGLGRMGASMAARLIAAGHHCVAFDADAQAVAATASAGATGAAGLADLARRLGAPRAVWLMLPAALVDETIAGLLPHLAPGDIVIDGGNSHFADDQRRATALAAHGLHYLDVGVSGGVHGRERGYCLMIGGPAEVVQRLTPVFAALAPGSAAAPPTPGRAAQASTAEHGYLHCGAAGAGHFVKMVHNGIEYGLMAAYAEGFGILRAAGIGAARRTADAETAPLADAERYRYAFDVAEIAELWRRGSVVGSWLLDLTARALARDAQLSDLEGRVSDSGEGRWVVQAAVDEGVPAPVISAALYARFASRGQAGYGDRLLSALRREFGGHQESPREP